MGRESRWAENTEKGKNEVREKKRQEGSEIM